MHKEDTEVHKEKGLQHLARPLTHLAGMAVNTKKPGYAYRAFNFTKYYVFIT